jgi:hypothetical protein
MAVSAKRAMGKPGLKVLADRGYYSGPEIRACELAGVTAYGSRPLTSASRKKDLFTKIPGCVEGPAVVHPPPHLLKMTRTAI